MIRISKLIFITFMLVSCNESSLDYEGLFEKGAYNEIIASYESRRAKYNSEPKTLAYIGKAYFELSKYEMAIEFFEEAIDLDPNQPMYYSDKGLAQLELNDFTGAILSCERAIEINPDYVTAYINRSAAFIGLKKWDWAQEDLSKTQSMTVTNEEKAYIHANLSTIQINNSEYDKALQNSSLAIELHDDISWAYRNRAFVHMVQNNAIAAIDDINSGLELDSNDPYLWMYKGILAIKVDNELDRGCLLLNRAIEEFKKNEVEQQPEQISIFEKYCN